ncbi:MULTISPECIES: reverse transcriptase family protein [Rhodobacterales]|jgi:hypothetical protein|uniref:RNA-directed DNA polymerase n=2 Tax=Rhodobacterales TaxID=204455 RepID=A0A1H6BST9_9RHOB|nr:MULTISPECIES: reverse transcriptase family protein [Rhodobacterales]UWS82068.1 reverse transcriptase domain-containing protein [Phaeobacter sp. G2]MBC58962.1 RNA-directed DNA polymerase [Actibacterium sp.]TYP78592.1 reverse transcriptase (RNA-dependent DNA polymerase) [Maritimibacter alkaliphilus HTCC2654]SEG63702.1 Reverse transcriptase (RNA-dependent DNA polymerase) [Thalassococcus halodurans]SEJ81139.1 Reverse transcriptase (RNA-dependent DNA polymerase) [Pseudooceanicola nitratireducens
MRTWNSQRYFAEGLAAGVDESILNNAIATAEHTLRQPSPGPPILTLGHLGHLAGVDVGILKTYASRQDADPYREFSIRKRPIPGQPPRYRTIAVPEPPLLRVQTWIASEVLRHAPCHSASTAFAPGSRLAQAAARHCRAVWMVKIDLRNFFESLTEIDVHRVFLERGYQPLVAFELARLCTRLRDKHRNDTAVLPQRRTPKFRHSSLTSLYPRDLLGVLPQGAPTSPMLANLAVRDLDERLTAIAKTFGVRYSRYADDLTFSTTRKSFGRSRAHDLVGRVYETLAARGLAPNQSKTTIVSPGARKVVLGLLVDGDTPKLTRDFRSRLRKHLYHISAPDQGPVQHAARRGFASVEGLRQHLLGLIAFAGQIDPVYAAKCRAILDSSDWSQTRR